jgi:hypothetical protein
VFNGPRSCRTKLDPSWSGIPGAFGRSRYGKPPNLKDCCSAQAPVGGEVPVWESKACRPMSPASSVKGTTVSSNGRQMR